MLFTILVQYIEKYLWMKDAQLYRVRKIAYRHNLGDLNFEVDMLLLKDCLIFLRDRLKLAALKNADIQQLENLLTADNSPPLLRIISLYSIYKHLYITEIYSAYTKT